jgi:hypothetical protein
MLIHRISRGSIISGNQSIDGILNYITFILNKIFREEFTARAILYMLISHV